MKLTIYYIIVLLSAMFYEDMSNIALVRIGGLVVYVADFITVLIFACVIRFFLLKKKPSGKIMLPGYLLLGWIVVGLLVGIPRYGFRAIGEVRTMVNYFSFFVPFVLAYPRQKPAEAEWMDVFRNTIFLACIGSLIIFAIEISIGGRFFISSRMQEVAGGLEDFRGIRILNSEQAFQLSSLAILVLVSFAIHYRRHAELAVVALLLFLLVMYSKNRTAAISIIVAFGIWMAVRGYFKLMLGLAGSLAVVGVIVFFINSDFATSIGSAFSGVTNISEDGTGQFRLLVQAAAIELGLAHPIMGEGFGGYFNYYIPLLNITYDVPPHSMYVYLFQKSGIIGTAIAFFSVIAPPVYLNKIQQLLGDTLEDQRKKVYLNLLFILIVAQIFYGFAYNFSMFFGLYLGFAAMLSVKNNPLSQPPHETT